MQNDTKERRKEKAKEVTRKEIKRDIAKGREKKDMEKIIWRKKGSERREGKLWGEIRRQGGKKWKEGD